MWVELNIFSNIVKLRKLLKELPDSHIVNINICFLMFFVEFFKTSQKSIMKIFFFVSDMAGQSTMNVAISANFSVSSVKLPTKTDRKWIESRMTQG